MKTVLATAEAMAGTGEMAQPISRLTPLSEVVEVLGGTLVMGVMGVMVHLTA